MANQCNRIFTKLEEHWQELRVDDSLIKKDGKLAQVACEHFLSAPVVARLVESLHDVLNVVGSFGLGYFRQKNVQIFHYAQSYVGAVMAKKFIRDAEKIAVGNL